MARSADPFEITTSIVVNRAIQVCWNLYTDNSQLSGWAPAVEKVEFDSATIGVGATRKCLIKVDEKSGHTVEQCTLIDPLKRIEFAVTEETFGFSHMLNSYGYSITFDVEGDQTLLVMQTRGVPKKIFASLMHSESTQRHLHNLMCELLSGFKHYAEASSIA